MGICSIAADAGKCKIKPDTVQWKEESGDGKVAKGAGGGGINVIVKFN